MQKMKTEKLPPKSLPIGNSDIPSLNVEDSKPPSINENYIEIDSIKLNIEITKDFNLKKDSFSMRRSLKLNFHDKKMRNIVYMLTHILVPVLLAACFLFALSLSQFYVRDYCFYKEICECQNVVIKLYTIFKEMITCDLTYLQLFYHWFFFLQRKISSNNKIKYFFIFFNVFVNITLHSVYINYENDTKMESFRMIKIGSFGVCSFFFY